MMVDPSPSTGTGMPPLPVAKKRGPKPKGDGRRKNRGLSSVKGAAGASNKKRKELDTRETVVVLAEQTENNDVAAEPTENDVAANEEDESDSEIEYEQDEGEENVVHGLDEFLDERNEPIFKSDTVQRLAIGYMFYKKFGAPEDRHEWRAKKIRPQLRKAFDLDDGTRIDHILNDVVACKNAGIEYTGTRKIGPSTGQRPLLALESTEAQIVADCLESGFSLSLTQWSINQHRKEAQKPSLTLSPIRHLMKRMKPVVGKVKKQAQGSTDPTSRWARARLGFNTQVLIRFGKLPEEEFERIRERHGGTLPAWFDPTQMNPLKPQQVAWWDETHRKCIIGGQRAGATHYVRFPRNPEGKLDFNAGKYDDSEVSWVNVKYEKEVRLCLGCGIREEGDGDGSTTVGVTAKPFCYSGKLLVSLKEDQRLVSAEIARVKSLSHPGPWLADTRDVGKVYENEKPSKLKGVGAKSEEKLALNGISTIKVLRDITAEKIQEISSAAKEVRISDSQLTKFKKVAEDAKPGDPPEKVDYRKFDNPYEERYGHEWHERIRKTSQLSPYVCVTKMIEHIVAQSALMFKGTQYEESWVFYHDALSLMTAKESVEWMKEHGHFERWLLPVMGLHSDDADLKAYLQTIPGNGPENMPWDLSLNKDAHEDINRHIILTHELADDDPRKFDLSTPKRGSWAYQRVLQICPSSDRIKQDILNVFVSMEKVRKADGILVEGLGKNYGRRYENIKIKQLRGGYRPRKMALDDYGDGKRAMHDDAKKTIKMKLEQSLLRVAGEKTKPLNEKMKFKECVI
jgi:hypothetical protein